jgi:hypothetical protein
VIKGIIDRIRCFAEGMLGDFIESDTAIPQHALNTFIFAILNE